MNRIDVSLLLIDATEMIWVNWVGFPNSTDLIGITHNIFPVLLMTLPWWLIKCTRINTIYVLVSFIKRCAREFECADEMLANVAGHGHGGNGERQFGNIFLNGGKQCDRIGR